MYIDHDPVIPVEALGLTSIQQAIRELRMQLEDAEWDGHPIARYYRHRLDTLKADAERGVLLVDPCF